jgi:hypothetical protein
LFALVSILSPNRRAFPVVGIDVDRQGGRLHEIGLSHLRRAGREEAASREILPTSASV